MATDAECISLILQKLFIVRGSQAASAVVTARVTTTFNSRIEYLREDGVCWWADDEIPSQCLDPLAEYMTRYCPVLPVGDLEKYRERSIEGLKILRSLAAKSSEGPPTKADYF